MRKGWKEVKIGDYCNVLSSKRVFASDYVEEGIPFYRSKEIIHKALGIFEGNEIFISEQRFMEFKNKYGAPRKGDILISSVGNRSGIAYLVKEEYDFYFKDGNLIWLKDFFSELSPSFLEFYLRSPLGENSIDSMMIGAAQKALTIDGIKKIKLLIPSLETQRKIASILSGYDDLIENNLKRIKILEEMAQQTYEEWFVRMRFPGHETAEMNEETGLPMGWEKVKISDVCTVSGGGTPSKNIDEYWLDGDINWYTPTDLTKNKSLVITDSELKTNSLGITKSSAKVLEPNSFIMTSRATIGIFALLDKPFSTNQGFINITPNNNHLKGYLLYNFMFRMDQLKGLATGTTFPELSKSKFKVLDIVRPSAKILLQFSEQFEIITKQVFNLTYQNQRLREARDILLPRLMMGMVEV